MSNLKNASLILKSTDLFDTKPSATILGYYFSASNLVVCDTNGRIPSKVLIKGVSTGTSSNNINTNGYGTVALDTNTTATAATSTVNMKCIGNLLQSPAATTTSTNARINDNILILGTANADISDGQFVTGTGTGGFINENTVVVRQITTFMYLLSTGGMSITNASLNFYDEPNINQYDGVYFNSSIPKGTIVLSTALSNYNNGLYYELNTSQTVAAANFNFYPTREIELYNNDTGDSTYVGSNGTCNKFRTSLTWSSINLRTLLGDMYNDYDLFNLCLNSISTAIPPDEISPNDNNLNVIVKMSGLPFINQTYDVANGCNRNNATICNYTFDANYASREYFYDTMATFGKNQELCNITISYERIIDGQDPATLGVVPPLCPAVVSPFPQIVFNFDIIGVEKYSKNGNRI